MRNFLITIVFLISFSLSAQDDLNQSQKEVKQTIIDFFDGFHGGDTTKLKSTMDPQIVMQTIARNKENNVEVVMGNVKTFLAAAHDRPKEVVWEERLLDFKIDANPEIAQVWTPYQFYINKKFSHCGVNIFQLFHNGERWKIIAIADTRKREGCF